MHALNDMGTHTHTYTYVVNTHTHAHTHGIKHAIFACKKRLFVLDF